MHLAAHVQSDPMEIIAHRGASWDAPENTLSAVKLAWEQGADAVEVDVHLSRDGRVVVIHDDNTRKIAGLKKKVCDQTWSDRSEEHTSELQSRGLISYAVFC